MNKPSTRNLLVLPAMLAFCGPCFAQAVAPAPQESATLLQFDFNADNPWPRASADVMPSTPLDIATSIEAKSVGTIDEAGSTTPSGGLLLKTDVGKIDLPWIVTYTSGLFPLRNSETNPGKLTLGLNLSASGAHPITVRIESFNARKYRSGGLETTITPAAPDSYARYSLDLSTMKAFGEGKFVPGDPFLQLTFELKNPDWADNASHEVRLDNIRYAKVAP